MKASLISVLYLIIVLMAMSCSDSTDNNNTKYTKELNRSETVVRYHSFNSRGELDKAIRGIMKDDLKREGLAVWSPDDNICDVYYLEWDFKTLGHEVTHCRYGKFHPEVLDAK